MSEAVITEVKDALKGMETKFNTAMSGLDAFKSEIAPKLGKMDAFDEAKFNKVSETIASAVEESQKLTGKLKAAEDAFETKHKLLEAELNGVKTALNRPAAGGSNDSDKEAKAQHKKLFNQFARSKKSNQQDFHEFIEASDAPAEVKALSVGSDPDGGYLVMPEFGGIIQTKVFETSPIRQLASVVNISTDAYEYVLDNGEADGEWVGETTAPTTETTPQFGKKSIVVHELAAKPKATQKMIDDGIVDIEAWLAGKVADIFARKEATAFVSGNGVGKPRGILSYAAGTDITQEQIEQVVTGSASTFTYDGMVDLQNALKEPYQANASFLYKRATNAALLKIKDLEGRPIFNMTYDKNAGLRPTLLGQTAYFANDMPAIASNALAMAYGDIKAGYQIVDRIGIRVLRDPYTNKPFVIYYTTKRVGGGVINHEALKLGKIST
ncbi:phage major capsid protein [Gemmata sp. G18]|uniref:Phage major capsid protein n=1 Tax=Gemmata palustris TaxID=2822762 RepID=A0ABS5BNV3_9BACT|nr:phage major capsid protein [Gemmata palustris]MBP3955405.1 phage major capsid protein [Gemmata palustris]